MAINTTDLLALEKLLNEAIGDDLEFDTTTNITTNKSIISTTLNQHDGGQDGFGDDTHWVYITEGNNAGVERKVGSTTYATATGTLYVYGANLVAESGAVTCRLHAINRTKKVNALKRAIEQLYPLLYKSLDRYDLITGNVLPNSSFADWASASNPDLYSTSNATAAANTTTTYLRSLPKNMKVTPSAGNGYVYIDSVAYPKLLDIMGQTVSIRCHAYGQTANDPWIRIYTEKEDGTTTQTLKSSTTSTAEQWTELELEDQSINDDLAYVRIDFGVTTSGQWAYFEDAALVDKQRNEYFLPNDFVLGHLSQVHIQTTGYSDEPCYDVRPRYWREASFDIINDGTYQYLRLDETPLNWYRMRLRGHQPLETLSSDSATITLDKERLNLIVAYAAQLLYEAVDEPVSSEDGTRYERKSLRWARKANDLKLRLGMPQLSEKIRVT